MTYVYVADAQFERATAAGAIVRSEPELHFHGERICMVVDPGGQRWAFAQRAEEPESS